VVFDQPTSLCEELAAGTYVVYTKLGFQYDQLMETPGWRSVFSEVLTSTYDVEKVTVLRTLPAMSRHHGDRTAGKGEEVEATGIEFTVTCSKEQFDTFMSEFQTDGFQFADTTYPPMALSVMASTSAEKNDANDGEMETGAEPAGAPVGASEAKDDPSQLILVIVLSTLVVLGSVAAAVLYTKYKLNNKSARSVAPVQATGVDETETETVTETQAEAPLEENAFANPVQVDVTASPDGTELSGASAVAINSPMDETQAIDVSN
jgi:hypothetical protein